MNSPSARASPKFKNIQLKASQSPQELKEKMRKNYKDKIQHCRGMLMDRFRGAVAEKELCKTLTDIYKSMFPENDVIETDELELMEEIKNELVQEEMDWLLKEYERSQLDIDWSTVEDNNEVICPICQKSNIVLNNSQAMCSICKYTIKTQKMLAELKKIILNSVEKHNSSCDREPQFNMLTEVEAHMYLLCDYCSEMIIIV